jgi:hypothetical protein
MDGLFEELANKLGEKFNFTVDAKNVGIDLESLGKLTLSNTFRGNYVGKVPLPLSDFFRNYYKAIKTDNDILFNESDIETSLHCKFFKVYQRIVEKLFFDYCLIKGLKFSDYEIQKDIYFYNNLKTISFDYSQSMDIFYIVMLLNLEKDCETVNFDLLREDEEPMGNGIPIIIPHAPNFYFNLKNSAPAMIIKVQGA